MVLNATFNNISFISLRKWSTNNFLREAWYEKDTTERKVSFLFYLYLDKVSANFIHRLEEKTLTILKT